MRLAPAPRRSLSAAVLGSVALHAVLLYAAWPRPPVASQSKVRVIEARLLAPPAAQAAAASAPPIADATPSVVEQPAVPSPPLPAPSPVPAREAPALSVPVSPPPSTPQPEKRPPAETPPPQAAVPAPPPASSPSISPAQSEANAAASAAPTSAYLPASELDPPPRPLTEIRLVYPPGAGMRQGEVVLDLLIGAGGAVEDVKIIEATPVGLFEASAISAFVGTRFAPGMRAGVPTAARMRVAVQYSATGMSVSGSAAPLQPAAPPR